MRKKFRPSNRRKYVKSRWALLSEMELQTAIRSAAAKERNKPRSARVRYRRERLEAVATYRKRFGEAAFLTKFSGNKLPPLENLWLPGGYAHWKKRIREKST